MTVTGTKRKKRNGMSEAQAGQIGGSAAVPKGFSKLTPKQRKEIARKAARARWDKAK